MNNELSPGHPEMTSTEVFENLKGQFPDEVLDIVKGFTLMDDTFMTVCYENNIPAAEETITAILKMDNLSIVKLKVQHKIKNPVSGGRGIRMDILAKDQDGCYFNVEVQNLEKEASVYRARYYSAMMDTIMLKTNDAFKKLRPSYMIFITAEDFFKKGLPLYHFQRTMTEDSTPLNDGNHIIYVNGAYDNLESPIGRLMHDFKCADANQIYNKNIRNTVSYFKNTEKGAKQMCQKVEKYAGMKAKTAMEKGISIGEARGISIGEARGISIGEARGISIGRQEGQNDLLMQMIAKGIISTEQAAQFRTV